MTDEQIIVPKSGILSLDELRAEQERRPAMGIGERGLKRYCSRKEVAEIALETAVDISERTYNVIAKEQSEQLEKLEAMCNQHTDGEVKVLLQQINWLEKELEARTTIRGLWYRLRFWLKSRWNDEVPS